MLSKLQQEWSDIRTPFWCMVLIFVIGIIFGVYTPTEYKYLLIQSFNQKVQQFNFDNSLILMLDIFWNNFFVSLIILIFFFSLLIPSFLIFVNGIVVGAFLVFIHRLSLLHEFSFFGTTISSLVPHGILELPAIFLAAAISTMLGLKLFFGSRYIPGEQALKIWKRLLVIFISIVIPALFVAAAIEVFITPIVAQSSVREAVQVQGDSPLLPSSEEVGLAEVNPSEIKSVLGQHDMFSFLPYILSDQTFPILHENFPTRVSQRFFADNESVVSISISEHKSEDEAKAFYDLLYNNHPEAMQLALIEEAMELPAPILSDTNLLHHKNIVCTIKSNLGEDPRLGDIIHAQFLKLKELQ